MTTGLVLRLNRTNDTCDVLAGGIVYSDMPYVNFPPPPLSNVGILDGFVLGPLGDTREVFSDHFTKVGLITGTIIAHYGDTPWKPAVTATVAEGTVTNHGTVPGAVRLNTNTASDDAMAIQRTDQTILTPEGRSVWLSARVRANAVANHGLWFGLVTEDILNYVLAAWDVNVANQWVLSSIRNGGGASASTTADPPQDDVWNIIDLVYTRGESVSIWIDGNGPTIGTDLNVMPASSTALTPFLLGVSRTPAANVCRVDMDWSRCVEFDPGINPSLIPQEALAA